jgi:hypothetical protein
MPLVAARKVPRHPLFDPSSVAADMIATSFLPSTMLRKEWYVDVVAIYI